MLTILEVGGKQDPADIDLPQDEEPEFDIEPLEGHARTASPKPLATALSALEQYKHCLTHLPFARWWHTA
eukprot:3191710-Heterocapsa_arctica.AAC.1